MKLIKSAVVIYSGGMDSYTLLNQLVNKKIKVFALSFNYGQRHLKELEFAKKVCKSLKISHEIADISNLPSLFAGSSLTSDLEVKTGSYETDNMKNTFVPNRNMTLLSLAISYAVSLKVNDVYYGAHAGDHAIYPDCRTQFVEKMQAVALIANYEKINIKAPFLHMEKREILKIGLDLGLDYKNSWTCYLGKKLACGKCASCIERLDAFLQLNKKDPLIYQRR